jgi:hypothetical protein
MATWEDARPIGTTVKIGLVRGVTVLLTLGNPP